jgi:FAS-associated factor 2
LVLHFEEARVEMKNFGISTNFPKRSFGEEEDGLTLVEAGLSPQAVVMVQDLDA